jgi:hypothetical protein
MSDLKPEHPLRRELRELIGRLSERDRETIGVYLNPNRDQATRATALNKLLDECTAGPEYVQLHLKIRQAVLNGETDI